MFFLLKHELKHEVRASENKLKVPQLPRRMKFQNLTRPGAFSVGFRFHVRELLLKSCALSCTTPSKARQGFWLNAIYTAAFSCATVFWAFWLGGNSVLQGPLYFFKAPHVIVLFIGKHKKQEHNAPAFYVCCRDVFRCSAVGTHSRNATAQDTRRLAFFVTFNRAAF